MKIKRLCAAWQNVLRLRNLCYFNSCVSYHVYVICWKGRESLLEKGKKKIDAIGSKRVKLV